MFFDTSKKIHNSADDYDGQREDLRGSKDNLHSRCALYTVAVDGTQQTWMEQHVYRYNRKNKLNIKLKSDAMKVWTIETKLSQ